MQSFLSGLDVTYENRSYLTGERHKNNHNCIVCSNKSLENNFMSENEEIVTHSKW